MSGNAEESVSLNVRVHNTALKMGARTLLPPLQGSPPCGGSTRGSAFGSTPGYSSWRRFAAQEICGGDRLSAGHGGQVSKAAHPV